MLKTAIVVALIVAAASAAAQDVRQCDGSLSPTIDQSVSDYSIAQSYMYVNAAQEYDKLKKSTSEERGASASYKFFGAEYSDSKSASEFQEKVRNRLTQEGFSMQESEARSSYRRYLSSAQLAAWSSCVQAVTKGGAIILIAESVSSSAFPIRAKWYPPGGVGSGTLVINVRNALIDGANRVQVQLQGATEKPFIVEPDNSTRQIVLTAEILGAADTLALPRQFARRSAPVIAAPRTTLTVRAADFLRPLNVALGGPGNVYGSDVLLNGPPYGAAVNRADFEFVAARGGSYMLKVEYAAAVSRPVRVILNSQEVMANALNAATGCWELTCQQVLNQGRVTLRDGLNVLRIERQDVFPHLRRFIFEPVD